MHTKRLVGVVSLAMAGTLGIGGATYATLDKAVAVSVDGRTRTIHTFGSSVADVLRAADIDVSSRDLVAPSPSAKVSDGTHVTVRYARPLTVVVDGRKQTHWVTALNVGEAFNDLGLRYAGAKMSTSRSSGIGRSGLDIQVRTRKNVLVEHDGTQTRVSAPILTVREALAHADVTLDADDRVTPALSGVVDNGTTVTVERVEVRTQTVKVPIPFSTVRKTDADMYVDESRTERAGTKGTKARVLRVTYVDGKKTRVEVLSERVVTPPVDRVIVEGTRERPADDGGGTGGGGGDVGGGVDDLNWAALAECESGGNPRAVNPAGYYGLYQFSLSTWASVGGSGNPIDNSPAEQTYRAKLLYKRAGAGQWPVCGSRLFS